MRNIIIAFTLAASFGSAAVASEKCNVAMSDWRPREALQAKLEADGWKVRSIKTEDGCYEAYAINADGKKIEAYFNPQTFQPVGTALKD